MLAEESLQIGIFGGGLLYGHFLDTHTHARTHTHVCVDIRVERGLAVEPLQRGRFGVNQEGRQRGGAQSFVGLPPSYLERRRRG